LHLLLTHDFKLEGMPPPPSAKDGVSTAPLLAGVVNGVPVEEKAPLSPTSAKSEDQPQESLELGEYLTWIKNQIDEENACLELPFTLMLLISFSLLSLLHLKQDRVFVVENSLKFDLEENGNFAWSHNFGHKTIHDANSIGDIWSWARIGYIPLVVQQSWSYSEDLQSAYDYLNATHPFSTDDLPSHFRGMPVRDDYLRHNRIIGGIRFQQERSESGYELCRFPGSIPEDVWKKWWSKPCMPTPKTYELRPQPEDAESFKVPPSKVEYLFPSLDSVTELQRQLIDMEDGCDQLVEKGNRTCSCKSCEDLRQPWIDEQTQRVEIGFVNYNAEYGLISLATCNFFFNRAGKIQKFVHIQSAWSDSFAGDFFEVGPMLICDAIYIFALGKVFFSEVREIVHTIRSSQDRWYKSFWNDYCAFWNGVDWVSIVCAGMVCTLWFRLFVRTLAVNSIIKDIMQVDTVTVLSEDYKIMTAELFEKVEAMCSDERFYRFCFCFYPMIVMARLFKSFDAQPRLSVVTGTMKRSAEGMIHFFIVFSSVYFCMAVNGVLLFGQDTEDFADLFRSIISCFRLMFGDWDWYSMSQVGREMAMVWFWMFNMIITIILLNMLLAILMDAYTEVKEALSSAQTLPTQVSEMIRRHRQSKAKQRVKLNDIWDAFFAVYQDQKSMLNSKENITPADIQRIVEGIPKNQAKRTWGNAKSKQDERTEEAFTETEIKKSLDVINSRCQLVKSEVTEVKKLIQEHDPSVFMKVAHWGTNTLEEQKTVLVGTVREIVDQLGTQVTEVLTDEMQLYEDRQRMLEVKQRDMLLSIKDSHRMLQSLREQTDFVMQEMQQRADSAQQALHQRGGSKELPTRRTDRLGSKEPSPTRSILTR